MSTTARHARNDRIVQLRARGITYKGIGEEVGLTERQVARIMNERKQPCMLDTSDPDPASRTRSNATATKLLDDLQELVGDIRSTARSRFEPNDLGIIRFEVQCNMAEQVIAELRGAPHGLAPADSAAEGRPPETDMS